MRSWWPILLLLVAGCFLPAAPDRPEDRDEVDDCGDDDPSTYVGAPELCDGIDNDCNGVMDADPLGEVDVDEDGSLSCEDCDDGDAANEPGGVEVCDGRDNDCDDTIDNGIELVDDDGDGVACDADCDDADATRFPGNRENCDGLDSDCDDDGSCHLVQVSVGAYHSCGIDADGRVVCWGVEDGSERDFGQVTDAPVTGTFSAVSTLVDHSCALADDGSVLCWGRDHYLQVTTTPSSPLFSRVSAGSAHNCAIEQGSGLVQCWGWANAWLVGLSCNLHGMSARTIAAGNSHTCLIGDDSLPVCCGVDDVGQATPPAVEMIAVGAGWKHSCGIDTTGAVHCWGIDDGSTNDFGQLTGIPDSERPFTALGVGDSHTCAVDDAGAIHCWGRDNHRQATPPDSGVFAQVDGGSWNTCAVETDGRVHCWGVDDVGQSTPP